MPSSPSELIAPLDQEGRVQLDSAGSAVNLFRKGRKFATILAVSTWRRALWGFGIAAGVEHAVVLRQLGSMSTVADIGANRGQFALAARHYMPSARILSFEPLCGPANLFRTLFALDGNVVLHQAAIGPISEQRKMHVSARDDSSSLLPISPLQAEIFPGTEEVSSIDVHVAPLETFVKSVEIRVPALLKLDVQGYELHALRGCEALLGQFMYVYAECSFVELYGAQALADEVISWLRERGFGLIGIYNMAYDRAGRAIQGDFLFKAGAAR